MAEPKVVIVGGGFGGLIAAKKLAHVGVRVTLVDRTNHHVFQPLLYQVASAGLSPADIASPIRSILSGQENVEVLLASVTRIDLGAKRVVLADGEIPYDFLVLAAGARTNYFGHPEWEAYAPGLKSLDDAIEVRRRTLLAFERAEREVDEAERARLLTFVAIGGGATGVELAGAFAELRRFVLRKDFRAIRPEEARVILVEAGPRILPSFDDTLSAKAVEQLEELGVVVRTATKVTGIDARGVELGSQRIDAATVVWAAGVRVSEIVGTLGVPIDPQGRILVREDLSIPGHPEAFAIGDVIHFEQDGSLLPGVSQVAMQGGQFVARAIERTIRGISRGRFHYFDKGIMATIGRSRAVAEPFGLKLSGFIAWLAWLIVHIWYLIGFRNRAIVMFEWFWAYVTYKRGARLITHGAESAQPPPQRADGQG
ncbi:MAG: NAD(P)/FAD-dependent oxidoreductase [Polyangiaceae bacterium]|jgi:NADH dehydrogenase